MSNNLNYTFIIGCARSGTSILGELVASHPEVHYIFEAIPIWELGGMGVNQSHRLTAEHATEPVKAQIREWFESQAQGKRMIVEKNPRNSLRVPYLQAIFPDAKFIHIVRDGRDVACSLVPGCGGSEWNHVKPPSWQKYYAEYSGAIRCAYAWKQVVEVGLGDLTYAPHLQIRYEDLINSPSSIAEEIFRFIGMDLHKDTLAFCEKISDDTSSPHHAKFQDQWYRNNHGTRTGRWRENLNDEEKKAIIPLLAPLLNHLGYDTDWKFHQVNNSSSKEEKTNNNKVNFCATPNQHARPVGMEIGEGVVAIRGYQDFVLTRHTINATASDVNLTKKYKYLQNYFTPHYLQDRSFLDLGTNAGFFCFLALQNGAQNAVALDIDQQYLDVVLQASETLGFENIEVANSNVADWQRPSGVVLALALVHWIYSCTTDYGSLDTVIRKLSELTDYLLIIEWVDPADPAIEFFHHTQWNQDNIQGPYIFPLFEKALGKYFARYEMIGEISSTRKVFAAFKSPHILDFSCPLPLLYPKETIVSSRYISYNPANDLPYWSRVYRLEEKICKQATKDLAERETIFLDSLSGSEYFPRVLEKGVRELEYSTVIMEYINGHPLSEKASEILDTAETFYQFILHILNILERLQEAGILHRDIHSDNILVRNGIPVLIDFGWAISKELPQITPPGLKDFKTPPDGVFSDIYQAGVLLDKLNNHMYPASDLVIARMVDPESTTRLENIHALRLLFTIVFQQGKLDLLDGLVYQLLEVSRDKQQQIESIVNEKRKLQAKFNAQIPEYEAQISDNKRLLMAEEQRLNEILNSRLWKVAGFLRKVRAVFISVFSSRGK